MAPFFWPRKRERQAAVHVQAVHRHAVVLGVGRGRAGRDLSRRQSATARVGKAAGGRTVEVLTPGDGVADGELLDGRAEDQAFRRAGGEANTGPLGDGRGMVDRVGAISAASQPM